jgi:hypothetical protein
MELKLNIHKIEENALHIGSIVTLKSNPIIKTKEDSHWFFGSKYFEKSLNGYDLPPFLCVDEVVVEYNKMNNTNTKKYRCTYFNVKKYLFESVWFYEPQIIDINSTLQTHIDRNNGNKINIEENIAAIDKIATNKNNEWEKKTKLEKLNKEIKKLEQQSKDYETTNTLLKANNLDIELHHSVIFKTSLLDAHKKTKNIPPFMTVKAIEMEKGDNNIYDKQSGKVIREVSLYKIKCMWYNPIDCKFSEEWFIPEALISIEEKIKEE